MTRTVKNAALRLGEADIAKLSPAVRAKLGLSETTASPKPAGKRFEVSWFAPVVGRRVTYNRSVQASNKSGAIAEVRAWVKAQAFREHKGATNFMASEVKKNPRKQKAKGRRQKNASAGAGRAKAANRTASRKNPQRKTSKNPPRKATVKHAPKKNTAAMTPVSPNLARRWLRTNSNRSDMVKGRVAKLATEMKAGRFHARSPLLFKNGKLVDGRHRLCAVVVANKSVRFPIERVQSQRSKNPPIWADVIGGLAGGAGYAAAAAYVADKLKKKKSPTVNAKKTKPAKRTNPPGDIHREFTGSGPRRVTKNYFIPSSAPTNLDQLGKLVEIKVANRPPLTFQNNPARLCAAHVAGRRRIFIALKNPYTLTNGADVRKSYNYGPVIHLVYRARKPHLYPGENREQDFIHRMGEEGGRRPNLILQNGVLSLRGGDYKIQREGIRN